MKRPHSPSRVPSCYVGPPDYRRPSSSPPPPTSFDEMRLRNDFRQAKKDLLKIIVDWDKAERSLSSSAGQMKTANPPMKAQLESQRASLYKKISKLKIAYYRLKQRVSLIDREMKSLLRCKEHDTEDGEISSAQVKLEEGEYDEFGLQQRKKKRVYMPVAPIEVRFLVDDKYEYKEIQSAQVPTTYGERNRWPKIFEILCYLEMELQKQKLVYEILENEEQGLIAVLSANSLKNSLPTDSE